MHMLCIAHTGQPRGHVTINGTPVTPKRLATLCGTHEREVLRLLSELEEAGVFSKTAAGVIFSRRMVRDTEHAEAGREAVEKRWGRAKNPTATPITPPITPPNRGPTDAPNTLEAEAEAEADILPPVCPPSAAPRAASPPRAGRGSRLPPDWAPSDADIAYADKHGVDWQRAAERFRNYWVAKAGKGGVMLDWAATWRNWVLKDAERMPPIGALPLKTSQWTVEQQNDEIRRLVGRPVETQPPLMRIAR